MALWPSDEELSKLSDEHKAMLAQKCVNLLLRKSVAEEAAAEVEYKFKKSETNVAWRHLKMQLSCTTLLPPCVPRFDVRVVVQCLIKHSNQS